MHPSNIALVSDHKQCLLLRTGHMVMLALRPVRALHARPLHAKPDVATQCPACREHLVQDLGILDMHQFGESFERESIRKAFLAPRESENFCRDWYLSKNFCNTVGSDYPPV